MKKIQTIFDRNWDGNRGIVDKLIVKMDGDIIATEKIDGTNVRLTIRNHTLVRLEKRRNPSKKQKHQGIKEPWYVDADEYSPEDKYIWEAAKNTNISQIEDGEWSGEAVGPKIQGNPLKLEKHEVVLFSHPYARKRLTLIVNPTIDFNKLKEFIYTQKSAIGKGQDIEGIVWYRDNIPFGKLKRKDFK